MPASIYIPTISEIKKAASVIKQITDVTPLQYNHRFSKKYDAQILFKREDLQPVRSYKIRGAYNKMSSLTPEQMAGGIVCASAGNHAQGVAYSCQLLKIKGVIFMPSFTSRQKIEQVKMFGNEFIEIILAGDTFDDAKELAAEYCTTQNSTFIHPFDDPKIIEGQATVGLEIINQITDPIDYVFLPVGGGGLAAGVSTVFKKLSPTTKIIGVEPMGAPSMSQSISTGSIVQLDQIDRFVDGAAVARVGDSNFVICREYLDQMVTVDEGKTCQTMLSLYNKDALVVEPAGALAISALDEFSTSIRGKVVVCIISGSNNDITRTAEIRERALRYRGLKHYFLVRFPQRSGALKEFVADVLGPDDDITHFEYTKKHAREKGYAIVGIELKNEADFEPLIGRMKSLNFYGEYLNDRQGILDILV